MDSICRCEKCQTFVKVFEFDGRLLGKTCGCYYEEIEKRDPKIQADREIIEEVKRLRDASQAHVIDTL